MNEQLAVTGPEDYDTRLDERTQQFVDAIEKAVGQLSPDMPVYHAGDLNLGKLKDLDAGHALPGATVWGASYSEYKVTEEDLRSIEFDKRAISKAAASIKRQNIGGRPVPYNISLVPQLPEGREAKKSAHNAVSLGNGAAAIVFRVAQLPGDGPYEGTVTHYEASVVPFDDYKEKFAHEKFAHERDQAPTVDVQPPLSSDDY